jgi:hypothetical protein
LDGNIQELPYAVPDPRHGVDALRLAAELQVAAGRVVVVVRDDGECGDDVRVEPTRELGGLSGSVR